MKKAKPTCIVPTIFQAMKAAGFPGENAALIMEAASACGVIVPQAKYSPAEFECCVGTFVGYVLEQEFRGIFLSRWRSGLHKLWRNEQLSTAGVVGMCLAKANAILASKGVSLPAPAESMKLPRFSAVSGSVQASASPADGGREEKSLLPLTSSAEIAIQKAVRFLHPSHGNALSGSEYHEAVCVIIEQACAAILNHKATHSFTYEVKKGGEKRTMFSSTVAQDCWPPAFDLRKETEDERFARMVLASY